jgi:hypothetical protein
MTVENMEPTYEDVVKAYLKWAHAQGEEVVSPVRECCFAKGNVWHLADHNGPLAVAHCIGATVLCGQPDEYDLDPSGSVYHPDDDADHDNWYDDINKMLEPSVAGRFESIDEADDFVHELRHDVLQNCSGSVCGVTPVKGKEGVYAFYNWDNCCLKWSIYFGTEAEAKAMLEYRLDACCGIEMLRCRK